MALYLNANAQKKKSSKLNYLSSSTLRSLYLIKLSPIHHTSEKKIFSRGGTIPQAYIGYEAVIHRGNKLKLKYLSNWLRGFKFGEFTWNRKIALYKSKQKKKKNKKK